MTFLSCKCLFTDEEYGKEKEIIDDISLNIDEISSFNPAINKGHTTVTMKNGVGYEIVCEYGKFMELALKYTDLPLIRINCN